MSDSIIVGDHVKWIRDQYDGQEFSGVVREIDRAIGYARVELDGKPDVIRIPRLDKLIRIEQPTKMPLAEEDFWLVWNLEGRNPKFQHNTESQATEEAERLATANPGQSFYVVKAVKVVRANVVVTALAENIPF